MAYRLQAQTLTNSGEVNAPHFSASCEIDLRWGKRRCGNCASSRLFALALDPGAMPLDESLDSERRRTRRHDDFHATGVKHAHSETTCAIALANDPSLSGVLIGPQRQLRRNHA